MPTSGSLDQRDRSDELSDDEVQQIFADQARVAKESALSDAEREAFANSPKLRGPLWLILPLFATAIVTLPIWGLFALSHRELALAVVAAVLVVWRVLNFVLKRNVLRR